MSGGERQRIALARAFLRDAPVLILDEPTSSVDLSTEATILEALKDVMRGRTTFVIAHRPDTLQPCDVLITIEEGRAVSIEDRAKKPKRRAGVRRKTPASQQSKTPSGARTRAR
jgi:ATP-binding cassette subfamily B protein